MWWIDRHPELAGGRQVEGQVVDVDALLRATPARSAPSSYMRLEGLRIPSSPEITIAVEELGEHLARVAVHAPRVRHQRRAHAAPWARRTASTISSSACTSGEEAVDQPLGGDLEQLREAALELVLGQLAGLQRDQQLACLGVGFEAPHELARVDPGAHAVGVEGGEQVGRQHPAPVDQQPPQR